MSDALKNYKDRVEPDMSARLERQRDLHFTASTPVGYDLDFDAANQMGCMPLEALLMSLAGCMAIDVVAILEKMRCRITGYRTEVTAERSPTPPQRLRKVHMVVHISGDVSEDRAARAVELSETKYCSVRHSLREDIQITVEVRID